MAIGHSALLLIVRRDQADQILTEQLDRLDRVALIVDRRQGERRQRENPRIAIQRRRADRRGRSWVDAGLAAQGAVLVRA